MAVTHSPALNILIGELPESSGKDAARQLREACEFAAEAHRDRRRESGERYIDHDVAVARIMAPLEVDTDTLVASLLHDVLLPHTSLTVQEVAENFGKRVATLVNSLNNLQEYTLMRSASAGQNGRSGENNLEIVRQAMLSIIEGDVRVILIRLADSLQDLRKASGLPKGKQLEIANEAMYIYAPLANRLGVWRLKWELENLAFRYLDPENYKNIARQLDTRRTERAKRVDAAAQLLRNEISSVGLKAEVTGRPKHIYSIHRKMLRKQLDFDQIHDIQALRVILYPNDLEGYENLNNKEKDVEDRSLCYQVLGVVHNLWQPIAREFDDYIGTPKSNGYRSLHTAVIDKSTGQKLEVQIRTLRMHEEAEKGIAAHWAYKEEEVQVSASAQRRIQNMRELLTALREATDGPTDQDVLESEMAAEGIYVYTPRGDVLELPGGSTPIDFAYQIHTSVGHRCRGARVNGKMVSLDYKLHAGDRVEIITAKRGGPSRDWMNATLGYTGSARTRSKIRSWFRQQERGKNIQQGREVVERELKALNLTGKISVEDIATALKYSDIKDFLARVGFGDIQSAQINGAIILKAQKLEASKQLEDDDEELRPLLLPERPKPKGLTILGASNLPTKMAGCCNPIPPEPIVGYITRGHGVTIHRRDCRQLRAITDRDRVIDDVDWGIKSETYPIPIVVKAYRRPNLVDDMAAILRGQNISAPQTKTTTSDSIVNVYLVVEVNSLNQLKWLLKKFEGLPNVIESHRQTWT